MLKLRIFIFLLLIATNAQTLVAQSNYGNEWIRHSQKYLKIRISQEGIFQISKNDIINSGLITNNIDPRRLQLFCKGKEVPLYISGAYNMYLEQDNKIFFYGKPNDGNLDISLYKTPQEQPNPDVSLFEDQNYYFLTYNNENISGLRFQVQNMTSSETPENFIITKSRVNNTNTYYPGAYVLDVMSLSEYIEGEGYLGSSFAKGSSSSLSINTENFITTNLFQPTLSFYVAGRSNASATNNLRNHHLSVSSSNITLFDTVYNAYKTIRKETTLNISSPNTTVTFQSIDDLNAATDYQAVGYAEIVYSRNLDLNNKLKNLKFSIYNEKESSIIEFNNAVATSPILIDIKNSFIYQPVLSQNKVKFIVNNKKKENLYFLGDLNEAISVSLTPVNFRNFTPNDIKEFLIITAKSLESGATAYSQYNLSKRNIQTTIAFTDDLYNEFFYGFHHPLAIRNFCKWILSFPNTKPEHLLLLGKGYEIPKSNLAANLVPTYGYPASDHLLTSGITSTSYGPAIATGRIPAQRNEDIINYIAKLEKYESLESSALWRKQILHATGGKSVSESLSFVNYMKNLYNIAKEEYFGASVKNFNKSVSDPVTENLTQILNKEVENGVALVSFLGHGSATGTEISFGVPSQIKNAEKPTIYLVNGCSTGNAFTSTNSYGEQFILQKDFGAICWIGTTSEGVASYLYGFTSQFYANWFKNLYGKSIGLGVKNGISNYTNANDNLNLAHSRQYIILGDPYIRFMSPEKPDLALSTSSIFFSTPNQNASQESLKLSIVVKNLSKAVKDSIDISITRQLPNNDLITYNFKNKPIFNTDTVKVELSNTGLNVAGNNKISVKIDPNNKLQEVDKTNNQSDFSFFLVGNGVKIIYPLNNSIINNVYLQAQPDNLFTRNSTYIFEIDTLDSFDSDFLVQSGNINADNIATWIPNILFENNKIYFWRVKINDTNASSVWTNGNFTYSSSLKNGAFITNKQEEIKNFSLDKIVYRNNKFDFSKDLFSTTLSTRGDDVSSDAMERRIRVNPTDAVAWTDLDGLAIATFHSVKRGNVYSYPSSFNSKNGPNLVNGYTGQFIFNTNNPSELDSMINYIKNIPDGYYVMGINNQNFSAKDLPENAKEALRLLGLSKFEAVGPGEPYIFWGKKGLSPGQAVEYIADYSSNIPPRQQYFREYYDLDYKTDNGSITTSKIGPTNKWESAEINISKRPSDNISYSVIGITKNNIETTIIPPTQDNVFDLSGIDASTFPYIKLKANFKNNITLDIPPIHYWEASFMPLPEVSFNPIFKNEFHSTILDVGDSLKLNLGISNLSKTQSSDSIKIIYRISKEDKSFIEKHFKIAGVSANQDKSITISESTIPYIGKNNLSIKLESSNGDNHDFNNTILYDFTVNTDNKTPNVEVTFDGKRIINRDIVSPTPTIDISSFDENKFLLQNDTSLVNVYLRKEFENNFIRINFSDRKLNIIESGSNSKNRLLIRYTPDKLEDAIYTLKVSAKDVLGNINTQNDFLTDFEVINESTLSNFYPYPNPVVDKMKFVFTLTGEKVPEKIKIQILSASGKVVREVMKEELGNIKIGNNISDFTWDGTDSFGDKLAKGIYFYKVLIQDSSTEYKHRFTKGDMNFKNNIGKIYLLR